MYMSSVSGKKSKSILEHDGCTMHSYIIDRHTVQLVFVCKIA